MYKAMSHKAYAFLMWIINTSTYVGALDVKGGFFGSLEEEIPVHLHAVSCSGTERSLQECNATHQSTLSPCDNVAIVCQGNYGSRNKTQWNSFVYCTYISTFRSIN